MYTPENDNILHYQGFKGNCVIFCYGAQHDGMRTTMKKGTPKILSKSISGISMDSLVGH